MTHSAFQPIHFDPELDPPSLLVETIFKAADKTEWQEALLGLCNLLLEPEKERLISIQSMEQLDIPKEKFALLHIKALNSQQKTVWIDFAIVDKENHDFFERYQQQRIELEIQREVSLSREAYQDADQCYLIGLFQFLPYNQSLPVYHVQLHDETYKKPRASRLCILQINEAFSESHFDA